jgi:hypothetical protein
LLVTALGRAIRWKRLLDEVTVARLPHGAGRTMDSTYVGDVMQLKLLAPNVV